MTIKIMNIAKLVSEIDGIQYRDIKCCYDKCPNQPITSHTIAENYLYKLNKDLTKVLTFEPAILSIISKQPPELTRKVDKKKFSTFTGFCNNHDHGIFKLIDSYDGKMTKEKAALLHYRIICYGINHIKTQLLRLQHMSEQNYMQDESAGMGGTKIVTLIKKGFLARRLNYCLKQHLIRKGKLEKMITSDKFENIEYLVIPGSLNNPIFCGRSSHLLNKNHGIFKLPGYSYMPWLTYMTLLTNETNHLVFCWLKSDKKHAKRLNNLLKKETSKTIIEVLAYACSDGFAVEESFYDKHCSTIDTVIKKFRVY